MKLSIEYGDVTKKYPEYVQAHCISEDCAMGSGVVIAYRRMFPNLKEECKTYVKWARGKLCPTSEHCYLNPNGSLLPYRFVYQGKVLYNMFTKKEVWMHAGTGMSEEEYWENLQQSLVYVRDQMLLHNEKKLAICKIGCGRDRCKWEDVLSILHDVFDTADIEIVVCEYKE